MNMLERCRPSFYTDFYGRRVQGDCMADPDGDFVEYADVKAICVEILRIAELGNFSEVIEFIRGI